MSADLWRKLNGLICLYKPSPMYILQVKNVIRSNLVADLNAKYIPPEEKFISIEGTSESELEVKILQKYSNHPLALGDVYYKQDIKLNAVNNLYNFTSGLCILGVNNGVPYASKIRHLRLLRTYRLSGELGKATINLHTSGKVVEKSRFTHVRISHLEKVLMTIQATHQKRAMEFIGVNVDPQVAYETIAEEGIVRPESDSFPLAYNVSCVDFNPPHFTIEVSCINEDEYFLKKMIHDIGLLLKTNATATHMRCIRYGPFTLDDALLRKHWRVEYIAENIASLRTKSSVILKNHSPSLKMLQD